MGALRTHYCEEIKLWVRENNRALAQYDLVEVLGKAFLKQQPAFAVNGFGGTGIQPIKISFPMLFILPNKLKPRKISILDSQRNANKPQAGSSKDPDPNFQELKYIGPIFE